MFLKSFYDHFIAGPGRLSSSERIICKGENPGPSDVPVCRMKDQAESRSTTRQTGLPQMQSTSMHDAGGEDRPCLDLLPDLFHFEVLF